MTELTDDQFAQATRGMAFAIMDLGHQLNLSDDDLCNMAGAALAEVAGQKFGPFAAVERLRQIADVMERQVMQDAAGRA